jgi:hypothetical protein
MFILKGINQLTNAIAKAKKFARVSSSAASDITELKTLVNLDTSN